MPCLTAARLRNKNATIYPVSVAYATHSFPSVVYTTILTEIVYWNLLWYVILCEHSKGNKPKRKEWNTNGIVEYSSSCCRWRYGIHISECSRSHLIKTRKIKTSARDLQGTKCYNRITVKGTNNNRKEKKENDRTRLRIRCRSTSYTDNAFQIIQACKELARNGMIQYDHSKENNNF